MPIERIVLTLSLLTIEGLRRHWFLFLLPLIVAAPIAIMAWKFAPTKYEAKSTILMISANRGPEWAGGPAGFPRQSAIEQIAVLEAWLKSDHVLGGLLPQLLDGPVPKEPAELGGVTAALRNTLTLQLIGASVLEIQLVGSEPKGLGRKLEIIIARLLEGVLNPEAGILSATQLIIARREDRAREADAALIRAIEVAQVGDPDQIKSRLQTLYMLRLDRQLGAAGIKRGAGTTPGEAVAPSSAASPADSEPAPDAYAQKRDEVRATISANPEVVGRLEALYTAYEQARLAHRESQERAGASPSSYVRVFDAPERLTIIGRPRDPLTGTDSGRKFAIAVMLLGVLSSLGLMVLAMLLDTRLRIGEDFEAASGGLPVLTRLPALRSAG